MEAWPEFSGKGGPPDFWRKEYGAKLGGVGTRTCGDRIHRKRLAFNTGTKR
jgi:hypothetical protein